MALPSSYKQLAFIQSSGTQYIDTGFTPNQDTRLDMVATPLSVADAGDGTGFIPYGAGQGYDSRAFECYTANGQYEFNYAGQYDFLGSPAVNQTVTISHNKNIVTLDVDGTQYTKTFTYNSFTAPYTMTLFGIHRSSVLRGRLRLYSCQIYNNGTLIRDFVPAERISDGVAGLYDLVNDVFYTNAGSGSFTVGYIPIGSSRMLLSAGTGYDVLGGKVLVGGTAYSIKKGRTLVDGTGYDIPFGKPVSSLEVGDSVYLNVDGVPEEFIIVHKGLPGSSYDDSCSGIWLLMKDLYTTAAWDTSNSANYSKASLHSYLNNDFYALLDAGVQSVIKQVIIPYGIYSTVKSGSNGLSTKVFTLSTNEYNLSAGNNSSQDGSKLAYFEGCVTSHVDGNYEEKRVAYLNGTATAYWTRSPAIYPYSDSDNFSIHVSASGMWGSKSKTTKQGVRPAFIIPEDAMVDDDYNLIA